MKKLLKSILAAAAGFLLLAPMAGAYEVPGEKSLAKYFYVFGTEGDPLMGAEAEHSLELFVDVPSSAADQVVIDVFDPDTSGRHDWRKDPGVDLWDTETEFTVFGKTQLDTKSFTTEYDGAYYRFGPYTKDQGEKVGEYYRFRLVVQGKKGSNENLFKVAVSPDSAETFAYSFTFRLRSKQGDKMYFYPQIGEGVNQITFENYDLDPPGGTIVLQEGASMHTHAINPSDSNEWRATDVNLVTQGPGRLQVVVTKATQPYANAGMRVKDASGNLLPIYFRMDAPPVAAAPAPARPAPVVKKSEPTSKCNTYTFDARKSYDSDNEKIAYAWDFGDGETSDQPVVTHTFPKAGDYVVTLRVTDNSGLECDTAVTTQPVTVNTPPTAAFTAPADACVGDKINLDASSSTDNTLENMTYAWSLSDGSVADGKMVSKTFDKGGVYKIRLSVNDQANSACSADATERTVRVNTAPVASAGTDIAICERTPGKGFDVRLNGGGSRDADGDTLSYSWDFGDGSTGEGQSPSHTYAQPGTYRAALTVRDDSTGGCSLATDSITVDLNRAPIADAGKDVSICSGSSVEFDASDSSGSSKEGLSYDWDFGDGSTGEGRVANHTYAKGGVYEAALKIDDGKSTACSTAQDRRKVFVNSVPEIDLNDVQATCSGKAVQFNATAKDADNDSLKLTWDFGDGTTQEGGTSVSHAYAKGGDYTVRVTADDGKGSSCSLSSSSVRVKVNTPPVASAGQNKACCVDKGVDFDASGSQDADGDALKYSWNFGDGSTGDGVKVSHAYAKNGSYTVNLTVDDGSGTACSQASSGFSAKVNAKPVPVIEVK